MYDKLIAKTRLTAFRFFPLVRVYFDALVTVYSVAPTAYRHRKDVNVSAFSLLLFYLTAPIGLIVHIYRNRQHIRNLTPQLTQ